MELMNERRQVRTVAERWRKNHGSDTYGSDKRGRNVLEELVALDVETATSADVEEITGGNGWVRKPSCNECMTPTWDAVQLGEEPDYESATAIICDDCLRAALRLLGIEATAN